MVELLQGPFGPFVILIARVVDMTLCTVRMVAAVRGQRGLATLIGFAESLIWVLAVGVAIQHIGSPLHLLGYAGGFALGNWVGISLEQRLAFGVTKVQIISRFTGIEIGEALRDLDFGVTEWLGQGREGRVEVLFVVCPRRRIPELERVVLGLDPDAFVAAGETRAIRRGWMGQRGRRR